MGSDNPAIRDLLWSDTSIFEARFKKSAAALVAVARFLEVQPRESDFREFLADYRSLKSFPDTVFTRVWQDPYAYLWARLAYELTASCNSGAPLSRLAQDYCRCYGDIEPLEALRRHLADFKRFLIGCAVIWKQEFGLDSALPFDPPLAIPGTPYVITGDDPCRLRGASGNGLQLELDNGAIVGLPIDGTTSEHGFEITECPRVGEDAADIRLNPGLYNIPFLDFSRLVTRAGFDYQHSHAAEINAALHVLQRIEPELFSQFRDVMQVIALKPADPGSYRDNLSHSDLPGAIVARPMQHPYYLAHVFVHEFHHNRLFFIEEQGRFLNDSDNVETSTRCYSPWRVDLRPLHGILHGLYVFIPVCRFWIRVLNDSEADPGAAALAREQLVRSLAQMRIACHQLDQFASFTSFGQALYEQMKFEVQELDRETRSFVPMAVGALTCQQDGSLKVNRSAETGNELTVVDEISEHISRYAPADQRSWIVESIMPAFL